MRFSIKPFHYLGPTLIKSRWCIFYWVTNQDNICCIITTDDRPAKLHTYTSSTDGLLHCRTQSIAKDGQAHACMPLGAFRESPSSPLRRASCLLTPPPTRINTASASPSSIESNDNLTLSESNTAAVRCAATTSPSRATTTTTCLYSTHDDIVIIHRYLQTYRFNIDSGLQSSSRPSLWHPIEICLLDYFFYFI